MDAEEEGRDVEREKNWGYTVEENDEWEKKLRRKKRRADFEFHGAYAYSSVFVGFYPFSPPWMYERPLCYGSPELCGG